MSATSDDLPVGPNTRPGEPDLIKGLTASPLAIPRPTPPERPAAAPAPTDTSTAK